MMTDLAGLGRLVSKDERDKKYLLSRRPEAAAKQYRYWKTQPALDQRDTSECVGYSAYQWLTAFPISNRPDFTPTDLYRLAKANDEWPGSNYEGSSVRGAFKALKAKGYVSQYRWAPGSREIVDHLLTVGPVVVGTAWTVGMFMPDRLGCIDDVGGEVTGGHAYLLIGANRKKSTPNGLGAVRILNSWGPSWAENGRAWMSFKFLDWLMKQDGEACTATEIRRS
jgi:hypothetical protein